MAHCVWGLVNIISCKCALYKCLCKYSLIHLQYHFFLIQHALYFVTYSLNITKWHWWNFPFRGHDVMSHRDEDLKIPGDSNKHLGSEIMLLPLSCTYSPTTTYIINRHSTPHYSLHLAFTMITSRHMSLDCFTSKRSRHFIRPIDGFIPLDDNVYSQHMNEVIYIFIVAVINTLRPRQDGRHFPDDIFKCIF